MAGIDYSIEGIEKLVKIKGTIKNVKISRLTAPGENFLSLVLRVDFEVEKDGLLETVSTVAKRLPVGDRIDFNKRVMTNEIKWYTEVLKLIDDFAKEEGIKGIDYFANHCGSRYSLIPENKEADRDSVLILENLISKGFINEDRYKGFDLNATKAILKRLALFHSVPLVMKIKRPDLFKILKEYLDGTKLQRPVRANEPDKKQVGPSPGGKSSTYLILEAMLDIPECRPHTDKLKLLMDKPNGPHMWHEPGIEPWSTLSHNNFWINNIMISPQGEKEPLVKIVDLQTCSYGSYAKDLLFFLLTSVDNDVTKTYIDDLLRLYYEEFTSVLLKSHVDLELPYTDFIKEVQRVAIESELCHALFFTNIVFGPKNLSVDEDVTLTEHMNNMIKNMNQHHKEKLIVIAAEAANRNWM